TASLLVALLLATRITPHPPVISTASPAGASSASASSVGASTGSSSAPSPVTPVPARSSPVSLPRVVPLLEAWDPHGDVRRGIYALGEDLARTHDQARVTAAARRLLASSRLEEAAPGVT